MTTVYNYPTTGAATVSSSVTLSSADDEVDLVDFSLDVKPIKFAADGERYECHPALSVPMMQQIVQLTRDGVVKIDEANIEHSVRVLTALFGAIMLPDSAERFNARLTGEAGKPLDLRRQVVPILQHILERYGLRPTEPSSDSSPGSDDETTGTASTVGASTEV
jgi:hypothetical protein